GTSVVVTNVATLTLSGQLALARVTPAGQTAARYTALKLGDVRVSGDTGNGDFGLNGTLTISALDYNSAAATFARLDWTHAFDLDGDGKYHDLVDPGAQLPTPADLAIDFASNLQFALSGSVTNLSVTAGPVTISGSAEFALTRRTVDVDTDGNGTADLLGATLDELALSVPEGTSGVVTNVATLTLSGQLALARVTPAGQTAARYTALKLGDVRVSGDTGNGDFGLNGTLTISALDYNSAAATFARLDWTHAFDLDGDGKYHDLVDPGAQLPTPADLAIDFASNLQFALSGSVTNLSVTAGPVTISGSAEF